MSTRTNTDTHVVRLRKVGDAISITIPKGLREQMAWVEGEFITVTVAASATRKAKGHMTAAPVSVAR